MHLSIVGCRGFRGDGEGATTGLEGVTDVDVDDDDDGGELVDGLDVSVVVSIDLLELVDEGLD